MALPDYPITRNEQYLNNIATGSGELPEFPLSREEQYLAYIAEHGGGGGGNVPDPTVDDIGKVVGAVAEGSGAKLAYVEGGGGLPPVTGSGKALVSVDGEWVEQSGYPYEEGSETVIVSESITTSSQESSPFPETEFVNSFDLDANKTYNVVFNGNEFTGLLPIITPTPYGDNKILTDGDLSTYEFNFLIAVAPTSGYEYVCSIYTQTPGTYTVTIKEVASTVHTIDPKYLPSTIPTTEDVQYMIETAIGDAIAAIPTKAMVVTYDDDTTETFNVLIQSE